MLGKLSIILLLVVGAMAQYSEPSIMADEICDNGIDDDGDGLIDLNDTLDCFCEGLGDSVYVPASLIPNYSFEDTLCCPNWLVQLHCAKNWIQASRATSDYYHTCGYSSDQARGVPPSPLPSGDAFVGFLDTWWLDTIVWKEYVGACLYEPMIRGKDYRLQFYLGFGTNGDLFGSRSPFTVVLYGTGDCNELPFGDANYTHCPSALPEWFEIGRVTLSGRNEWVRGVMSFIPNQDVHAIALGSTCDDPRGQDYYFLDELILNERVSFERFSFDIQGEVCDDIVKLWTSGVNDIEYQWYKDGVAIMDANEPEYFILDKSPGTYILRASDGMNCDLSDPFEFYPVDYHIHIDTILCQGEVIKIGNKLISEPTHEVKNYATVKGCDSIITIDVDFIDTTLFYIDTAICQGDHVVVFNDTISSDGVTRLVSTNYRGCDSIVLLNVNLLDTFHTFIDTHICQGEAITLFGKVIDKEGQFDFNLTSAKSCDSIVTCLVTERQPTVVNIDSLICQDDFILIGDSLINNEGSYVIGLQNRFGCDSTVNLIVRQRDNYEQTIDTLICSWDSILWLGSFYSSPGFYEISRSGKKACDSLFILDLRVSPVFEYSLEDTVWVDCFGDSDASVEIDITGSRAGLEINWSDGATTFDRINLEPGNYEFQIINEDGCALDGSLVVAQPDPLEINVEAVDPNCNEDNSGEIKIKTILGGQSPYSIIVNGEQADRIINDLASGSYNIVVADKNGCQYDTVLILDQANAGAMHMASTTTELIVGDYLNLSLVISNVDSIISIVWTGAGQNCFDCLNWDFQPPLGEHLIEVEMIDANGCRYFDFIKINVIQSYYIPNVFTPNGDWLNDVFNVFADRSIQNLLVLRIFDRWGELIFEGKDIEPNGPFGWDGTFNGSVMEPGVYVYYVEIEDLLGTVFKEYGDVTLLR